MTATPVLNLSLCKLAERIGESSGKRSRADSLSILWFFFSFVVVVVVVRVVVVVVLFAPSFHFACSYSRISRWPVWRYRAWPPYIIGFVVMEDDGKAERVGGPSIIRNHWWRNSCFPVDRQRRRQPADDDERKGNGDDVSVNAWCDERVHERHE